MTTILSDSGSGSSTLQTHTADTGGAQWVKDSGPDLTLVSGQAKATSATPGTRSVYYFDVPTGTPDGAYTVEGYLTNADGSSALTLQLRRQGDGTQYWLEIAGNGTVILYNGISFAILGTWTPASLSSGWVRAVVAVNSGYGFTLSLWWDSIRANLGTGPALVINAVLVTDGTSYIAGAGRLGVGVRNAELGFPITLTDSASAGPVITGPLTNGGRTHSTLTQGRLAS